MNEIQTNGFSLIEILITISIVSLAFMANTTLMLNIIARHHSLDKHLQTNIQLENEYELQRLEQMRSLHTVGDPDQSDD